MVASMGAWEDGFAAGWAACHGELVLHPASREAREGVREMRSHQREWRAIRAVPKRKRTRAPSAYNKRLGAAIKRINKRAKKKDGNYRKGWSRSKVFKMAHKEARRK